MKLFNKFSTLALAAMMSMTFFSCSLNNDEPAPQPPHSDISFKIWSSGVNDDKNLFDVSYTYTLEGDNQLYKGDLSLINPQPVKMQMKNVPGTIRVKVIRTLKQDVMPYAAEYSLGITCDAEAVSYVGGITDVTGKSKTVNNTKTFEWIQKNSPIVTEFVFKINSMGMLELSVADADK